VCGLGEKVLHPLGMLFDGESLVGRKNTPGKDFDGGVIAVVVVGDGVTEPRQIPQRRGSVWLLVLQ
jgi:hypothetical protein